MKAKLDIIKGLAHYTASLILDEATGNLDPVPSREINQMSNTYVIDQRLKLS